MSVEHDQRVLEAPGQGPKVLVRSGKAPRIAVVVSVDAEVDGPNRQSAMPAQQGLEPLAHIGIGHEYREVYSA